MLWHNLTNAFGGYVKTSGQKLLCQKPPANRWFYWFNKTILYFKHTIYSHYKVFLKRWYCSRNDRHWSIMWIYNVTCIHNLILNIDDCKSKIFCFQLCIVSFWVFFEALCNINHNYIKFLISPYVYLSVVFSGCFMIFSWYVYMPGYLWWLTVVVNFKWYCLCISWQFFNALKIYKDRDSIVFVLLTG
jgi:hypothetical protein